MAVIIGTIVIACTFFCVITSMKYDQAKRELDLYSGLYVKKCNRTHLLKLKIEHLENENRDLLQKVESYQRELHKIDFE